MFKPSLWLLSFLLTSTVGAGAAWATSWNDQIKAMKQESRALVLSASDRYSDGGGRGELCLQIGVLQEKARALVEGAETPMLAAAQMIELEILKMRGFCGASRPAYEHMVSLYDYKTLVLRSKALQAELDKLQ